MPLRADSITAKPPADQGRQALPVPTGKTVPLRVLWGDAHLHTTFSFDAGFFEMKADAGRCVPLSPDGEEVVSTAGV